MYKWFKGGDLILYMMALYVARSTEGHIQYFAKVYVAGASSHALGPGSSASVASSSATTTPKTRKSGLHLGEVDLL